MLWLWHFPLVSCSISGTSWNICILQNGCCHGDATYLIGEEQLNKLSFRSPLKVLWQLELKEWFLLVCCPYTSYFSFVLAEFEQKRFLENIEWGLSLEIRSANSWMGCILCFNQEKLVPWAYIAILWLQNKSILFSCDLTNAFNV